MDFIRVGEALLRSPQPLLPFLAPSVHRAGSTRVTSRHLKRKPWQCAPSRSFAATSRQHQQGAAAARKEPDETANAARSSTSKMADEFTRILDSALDGDKGVPTAPTGRTSRFKTPSAQVHNSQSRELAAKQQERYNDPPLRQNQTTEGRSRRGEKGAIHELFSDLLETSHASTPSARHQARRGVPAPGTNDASSLATSSSIDPLNISDLVDPQSNVPIPSSPTIPSAPPIPKPAPFKLSPSLGRTILIDPPNKTGGMDPARAFRALEITCARNSVRRDFMRQRFHERPGLKRKRLKSERWRRRFKEAFRGTVGMVQRMRGMGW